MLTQLWTLEESIISEPFDKNCRDEIEQRIHIIKSEISEFLFWIERIKSIEGVEEYGIQWQLDTSCDFFEKGIVRVNTDKQLAYIKNLSLTPGVESASLEISFEIVQNDFKVVGKNKLLETKYPSRKDMPKQVNKIKIYHNCLYVALLDDSDCWIFRHL